MRLHKILPEYKGRVRLVTRAFPLEVYGGGPPERSILESEIWLAALQEPEASFNPFGKNWPETTMPAFEAAWIAFQQDEQIGQAFDLRIRHAFFAEGRNIGQRDVMEDLAREAGLDMRHFNHYFHNGSAQAAVLAEGKQGKEIFKVRGTPTIMLRDGTKLRHLIAYPRFHDGIIQSVGRLPCCGEGCYEATRKLFEKAINHDSQQNPQE